MRDSQPPRVLSSLIVGALTAAIVTVLWFAFDLTTAPDPHMSTQDYIEWAVEIFVVSFTFWFVGLLFIGLPVWWLLHRYGYRSWAHAIAIGFVLPVIARWRGGDTLNYVLRIAHPHDHGWAIYRADLVFGAIGIIVALAVWNWAYRMSKP